MSFERLDIFIFRLGSRKRTLEEAREKRNVTRERIRQLTSRMGRQFTHRLAINPCLRLQTALAVANDMGKTITQLDWARRITKSGLLGEWNFETAKIMPEGVTPLRFLVAICNPDEPSIIAPRYPLPDNLKLVLGRRGVSPVGLELLNGIAPEKVRAMRRQAKNGGAINVNSTARDLSLTSTETRSIFSSLGYQRISDEWYMLPILKNSKKRTTQWAAFHTILKMVHFCGPLTIKDIHNGLRQHASRLGFVAPPPAILEKVALAYGLSAGE